MHEIGVMIARLHDGGIIHGDLTTSNMMVRSNTGGLVSDGATWSTCGMACMW
jgi:tRNA A-37 threonylcarbamoyl transferase component Bud32